MVIAQKELIQKIITEKVWIKNDTILELHKPIFDNSSGAFFHNNQTDTVSRLPVGLLERNQPCVSIIKDDTVCVIHQVIDLDHVSHARAEISLVFTSFQDLTKLYYRRQDNNEPNNTFFARRNKNRTFPKNIKTYPISLILNRLTKLQHEPGRTNKKYDWQEYFKIDTSPKAEEYGTLYYNLAFDKKGDLFLFRQFRGKLSLFKYNPLADDWKLSWDFINEINAPFAGYFHFIILNNQWHLISLRTGNTYAYNYERNILQPTRTHLPQLVQNGTLVIDEIKNKIYIVPENQGVDYTNDEWRKQAVNAIYLGPKD